jgi:hypothetical protein
MSRPNDPFEIWSTDENYPAGAAAWNGTATKIAPGSGKVAEGFEPNESPPAQWVNWQLNRHAAFIAHHDLMELRNWTIPENANALLGFATVLGGSPVSEVDGKLRVTGWDSDNIVGGRNIIWSSEDNGLTWDTAAPNNDVGVPWGDGIRQSAWSPGGLAMLVLDDGSTPHIEATAGLNFRSFDGTWGGVSVIPLGTRIRSLQWVARDEIFMATGLTHTGAGMVLTLEPDAGGPIDVVKTVGTPGAVPIQYQAHSPEVSVVTNVTGDVWTTDDVINNPWVSHGFKINLPKGLVYWEAHDIFLAIATSGKVLTSADGATWVEVSDLSVSFTGAIAVDGGVCVAETLDADNVYRLRASVDAGATWEIVARSPAQERETTPTRWPEMPTQSLAAVGRRFVFCARIDEDQFKLAMSLRV